MAVEARSYVVPGGNLGTARYEARRVAQAEGHPNPMDGSIVWAERVGENRYEVCIATCSDAYARMERDHA